VESTRTDPQTINKFIFQLETLIAIGLAVFLLVLPFHLVLKRLIPGPVGTYWKEILLGILVILWLLRCLIARKFLFSGSPIDWAVLIYLAFMVLRFIFDRSGWVGAWGLYISVMYLPVFWLVPTALHLHSTKAADDSGDVEEGQAQLNYIKWINRLIVVLVISGTLIAIGGILEFLLDYPLWPSDEVVQRQGFSDVYIYNTQIRRVYFTLDSPTALANTLAMLLPLALVLPFTLKQTWARILAGIAAALMAACIILTFSRGIWVAVIMALIVMGIISGFLIRNWKSVLVFIGSLVLIGLVWGIVMLARTNDEGSGYQGLLELSSSEYLGLAVKSISQSLLLVEPEVGDSTRQSWALNDPMTGLEDIREVLYEHPPENGEAELIYRIEVPESAALRFAIAVSPDVWAPEKGDGTSFQIFISETQSTEKGEFVFVRYINPKLNPSDRRWRNYLVDLSPWAGQSVEMRLITESGPDGDWSYDWAGWADLQIVTIDPNYLVATQKENAIIRHTSSILDWVRDETNRDRIAAWNLSLAAWRNALIWGNGLGSTGVAALRTNPENAIVTESQFLKGLVELGIPGFLLLAFLWFQIGTTSLLAFQRTKDAKVQAILLGVVISLLIVFIEGLVYQNLEVKQVNAYFWTIVGILAVIYRSAG
jgi:hypothetical protein